jgi:hypothetical protein
MMVYVHRRGRVQAKDLALVVGTVDLLLLMVQKLRSTNHL